MIKCPCDTCRFNDDGICDKEDVVLVADGEGKMLCKCYEWKEDKQ